MTERKKEEVGSILHYFSLLGLSEDAGQDEIEARYRELSDHLASAAIPDTLRDWANREAALLDEAYAILSDQELRAELEQASAHPAQAAPATEAVAAAVPAAQGPAPVREPAPREEPVSAIQALLTGVPWKLMGLGGALGLVILAVAFSGFGLIPGLGGGGDDSPAVAQEDGIAPIDTERVAELMTLVQEDPKNVEATFELGEIFFLGGEWQAGIDWFTKLLELDPENVHALTDVGTAAFNLGKYDESKEAWLKAREIDPNDAQVHYNLGFLYANVEPVDFAAAFAEWQTVVDLAPGSDLAATAEVHLGSLSDAVSPSASPAAATPEAAAPEATEAPESP